MNVWKLSAVRTLVPEAAELKPEEGKFKVRVTKVLLSSLDAAVFSGATKVRFPLIPCRFAVGMIAEETGNAEFPKGQRVLLHTTFPAPEGGTEKKSFTEDDLLVAGLTADGYLRDFVYLGEDEMTALPDAVDDVKALLIWHVALAKATVDALSPEKGDHIAVIGADLIGLFVSELLIYQQAAPILIDSRTDRLDFARVNGIYYAYCADETLIENVGTVTGGRLADGAVFVTSAQVENRELLFDITAREKRVAICGPNGLGGAVNFDAALKKQLNVSAISDGSDYLTGAINLIANKAVKLDTLRVETLDVSAAGSLLAEYESRCGGANDRILLLNLV